MKKSKNSQIAQLCLQPISAIRKLALADFYWLKEILDFEDYWVLYCEL